MVVATRMVGQAVQVVVAAVVSVLPVLEVRLRQGRVPLAGRLRRTTRTVPVVVAAVVRRVLVGMVAITCRARGVRV